MKLPKSTNPLFIAYVNPEAGIIYLARLANSIYTPQLRIASQGYRYESSHTPIHSQSIK